MMTVAGGSVSSGPAKAKTSGNTPFFQHEQQTFVFFFTGFNSTPGNDSGLDRLRGKLDDDSMPATLHVAPVNSYQLLSSVGQSFIRNWLAANNSSSNDKVILVGHSFGGNHARILASDVDGHGKVAAGIAVIDPIDWLKIPTITQQFAFTYSLPAGMTQTNVRDYVQANDSLLTGYSIGAPAKNESSRKDADGNPIKHGTIDDDDGIHQLIRLFILRIANTN